MFSESVPLQQRVMCHCTRQAVAAAVRTEKRAGGSGAHRPGEAQSHRASLQPQVPPPGSQISLVDADSFRLPLKPRHIPMQSTCLRPCVQMGNAPELAGLWPVPPRCCSRAALPCPPLAVRRSGRGSVARVAPGDLSLDGKSRTTLGRVEGI